MGKPSGSTIIAKSQSPPEEIAKAFAAGVVRKSCLFYPQRRTLVSATGCPLCAISGHSLSVIQLFYQLLKLLRHIEPKRLGDRQIDDEIVFCRRLHWEIDWSLTLEQAVGICRGKPELIPHLAPVRH